MARQSKMIRNKMRGPLEFNKKKATQKNPNNFQQIEIHLTATDRQIDRLVYELYGLTEEEVGMVEGRDV
jgi:adenine-specific DNA-methyltransferase